MLESKRNQCIDMVVLFAAALLVALKVSAVLFHHIFPVVLEAGFDGD